MTGKFAQAVQSDMASILQGMNKMEVHHNSKLKEQECLVTHFWRLLDEIQARITSWLGVLTPHPTIMPNARSGRLGWARGC